ncbi:MAG: hypothetical protein ACE37F_24205 [Nannocystaceae bacterium]|nr:hypothetical protein [bacterium]
MHRLRWLTACGVLGLACSSGDAAPGSTGANTTTGSGPTTFATFSTTAPPATSGSTGDLTDGSSESTAAGDTDTDTDSDADASSTGSGLCPATHVCLDEAPKGWSGPVAVHQGPFDPEQPGAEPPGCGEAYPDLAASGFEGLVAEPASCSCSCADPNGTACDNSTTLRYWADDATCGESIPQALTVFAATCNVLPTEFPGDGHYSADPLPAVGGACAPSGEQSVEPTTWSAATSACDGAAIIEDAGCAEGRACAPLPDSPEAALCIWQEGEHECPEAFGSTRTIFGGVDDGRDCETCSCGAPAGLCDDATISLWNGVTCLVPSAGVVGVDGECDPSGTSTAARAASMSAGSPNAFCVPSEGAPTGEAVGTEPVTVCCVDP